MCKKVIILSLYSDRQLRLLFRIFTAAELAENSSCAAVTKTVNKALLAGVDTGHLAAMATETHGWLALANLDTHTHTHTFNGPFSGTTQVSQYQKGRTNLDFTEARDSEWQWHQLGHMQVCTSLQKDNHASTPPLSFFTGRMPFLPPNQQRQSTGGNSYNLL